MTTYTLTITTDDGNSEVIRGLTSLQVSQKLHAWFEWLDRYRRVSIRFEVREEVKLG